LKAHGNFLEVAEGELLIQYFSSSSRTLKYSEILGCFQDYELLSCNTLLKVQRLSFSTLKKKQNIYSVKVATVLSGDTFVHHCIVVVWNSRNFV
jgi:hypothetical protein